MLPKPATNAVLKQIRDALGLTQAEFAALTGLAAGTISDYERGDSTLRRSRLERIAGKVGIAPAVVDALLAAQEFLYQHLGEDLPIPLANEARASIWAAVTAAGRTSHASLLTAALAAQAEADRAFAAGAWEKLKPAGDLDRRVMIERVPGFPTWALVERLAAESIELAPGRPDQAMQLARLALLSAELAPVSDAFRGCLLGYAHAHIGNAYRVAGDLRSAEASFVAARQFWPEGTPAPAGLLSEARLFDLEASLRRDLRQFTKALALIERALVLAVDGPMRGRIFIKQSFILEQQGDYQGSLEALRAASLWIDATSEPWLYTGLLFNLCVNLVDQARYAEAREIVPGVRERFLDNGNEFDLIRLSWLDGRIHEGLGDLERAIATIDQARADFTANDRYYDAALAGLDLAALYLRTDRTAETRDLARRMAAVFRDLDVKREELAAVRLFLDAAEREVATVELARRAAAAIRAVRRVSEGR